MTRRPIALSSALTLLALSSATASASDGPLAFEQVGDEKYAEQIVAIADLADGSYAKILFGVSNVGPGDGKGGCQFFVIDADGAVWHRSTIVERDAWSYDARTETLTIGKCTAKVVNGALVLDAAIDGERVELTLGAAPRRERAAAVEQDGDFWQLDTLVKWSKASVRLVRGGKERTLTGRGYADHPRSKIMPGDLAKQWFRFRGLGGDDPRLVMIRWPQRGAPEGWHDSKTGGRTALDRMMLRPSKGKGWMARFKADSGEWRVTTTKLLHRDAPIEARGRMLASVLGAVVGNPVTYTFRGVLEERGTGAKIPGIVEVTLTDE